uniref:Putative polyprotein n=1 Tax=Oryza sativa subsp. japonica TaxID=39947 RepID=Q6UUI9_ORYSJ|nr:putative polyprotein [Oryza sativa Japonica Group]
MFEDQARAERFNTSKSLFACRLAEGNPVSPHEIKMIGYTESLDKLGFPLSRELATDLILQSLPPSFEPFIMNFNMNNLNRTLAEVHGMLKTAEESIKKNSNHVMVMHKRKPNNKKSGQKRKLNSDEITSTSTHKDGLPPRFTQIHHRPVDRLVLDVCDMMPRSVDVNGMVMAKLRIEVGERSKSIPGEDDGRLMKESGSERTAAVLALWSGRYDDDDMVTGSSEQATREDRAEQGVCTDCAPAGMDYSGEENSDGGAVISEWNRDDHNRHVVKTMEAEDKSSGAARALEITDLSDIHRNVMATMWFSSGSIATATIVVALMVTEVGLEGDDEGAARRQKAGVHMRTASPPAAPRAKTAAGNLLYGSASFNRYSSSALLHAYYLSADGACR